jgi:hypothetical protein
MGTMSYQFGNIFVQAMENQKRLATQRQQFDQSMGLQREQMAQQESQFARGHELQGKQVAHQGRQVNLEESRERREASIDRGRQFQTPEQLSGFERTVGIPEGTLPGEVRFTDIPNLLHPILQREDLNWRKSTTGQYWTDRKGNRQFVGMGQEVPTGYHTNVDEAVGIQTLADIDRLTQEVQPLLGEIQRRPSRDALGEGLDKSENLLMKLRGLDARNLTPEQHQSLGLDSVASNVQYVVEAFADEKSMKELERKFGKRQAHEMVVKAHSLRQQLQFMGVDMEAYQGAYYPDFKDNNIGHPFLDILRVGHEQGLLDMVGRDGGLLNMRRSNQSGDR